jgi:stalled ribosome rescue protein Dom34
MKHTNATNDGATLKIEAGLWVDHRAACIVIFSASGETTTWIPSNEESQLRRSGEPSTGRFEYQQVPADDSRQREYTGHLARYYDKIISHLRDATDVVIFGPGEAKGELKKRFAKERPGLQLITTETTDKMSEGQIVAYVRHHFHHELARQKV